MSGPKRSVTAPVMGKIDVCVETRQVVEEPSPVSPPRHMLDDFEQEEESGPTFGAFRFGGDAAADVDDEHIAEASSATSSAQSSPVSPAQKSQQHHVAATITPPPEEPQIQHPKLPEFSRMGTMPPLHHAPLSFDAAPIRPSTSAGPLAPRSFRRISRPTFLSPTEGGAEELAGRLSAFLFGGGHADQVAAAQRHSAMLLGGKSGHERRGSALMEEMLKEPGTPRGRAVFGKGEGEGMPVSGIFEVLTEG